MKRECFFLRDQNRKPVACVAYKLDGRHGIVSIALADAVESLLRNPEPDEA